jgi:hypothetical protein
MLSKDFKEFLRLLSEKSVSCLVIGGYAVAFHGYPRYTKDIDIWIKNDRETIDGLLAALNDFGFGSLGLEPADFTGEETVFQLGHPPNRIDILTELEDMDFDSCYARRHEITIDDVLLTVIDVQDLIKAKRTAGRHQDLADVENLEE